MSLSPEDEQRIADNAAAIRRADEVLRRSDEVLAEAERVRRTVVPRLLRAAAAR